MTTTDLPIFFRTPHGPGWALVGDAGRHRDPFLAHGIADAFRDAELLAGAIDAGLSGEQPLDHALATFEQDRNRVAMPSVEFTNRLAMLGSPDADVLPLLSAMDDRRDRIDRVLGLLIGSVPVSEAGLARELLRG